MAELIQQPEDEENKFLYGPYSINVGGVYFNYSKITVKDEVGNPVDIKIVDGNGNELNDIGLNTNFYLSFKEYPGNTTYTLNIAVNSKRISPFYYEKDDVKYLANTYINEDYSKELTLNFMTKATIGKIELTNYDENGEIYLYGTDYILYKVEENNLVDLGHVKSGGDGKVMFYKVPEGKYKIAKLDEKGNVIKMSEEFVVTGGKKTSVDL